jgi:methanethiol S-methyltransferase
MSTTSDRFTRVAIPAYALVAYAAFVAVALWAVGFLADEAAPTAVDGPVRHTTWVAVLIDLGLFLLFALQHSVMARPAFKRRECSVVGPGIERSTFVLATSVVLGLLFACWQPLPGAAWHVNGSLERALLWGVCVAGWALAVGSTFMIDHLDFIGLRQAARHAGKRPQAAPAFKEQWCYAWVRHPMMLGLLVAFWATPTMSAGHLLFAAAASGYIAVGLQFEERDLRRELGAAYEEYASRVPALVPAPGRARGADAAGDLPG